MESRRTRWRPDGLAVVLVLALFLLPVARAWSQPAARNFDIPAGAMVESLNLFARQAGVRVLFPYELAAGKRTPSVRGRMTSDAALDRLLNATGVEVASRADDVVILRARARATRAAAPASPAETRGQSPDTVDELVVTGQVRFGPGQLQIGATKTATAAVSGFGQQLIQSLAVANPADLFRVLPGFQVSDFGQGPVAQGIALRGWTAIADGQDLAFYVDGAPRNQVSGANSNGYLDINPVIPETIGQVTVIRGPFDIRYGGNLALGASVLVESRETIPSGAALTVSGFGGLRGLAAGPLAIGPTRGYVVFDASRLVGYRDNSDGDALNLYARLNFSAPGGRGALVLQGYRTRFGKPSYLPFDDLEAGSVGPRDAVDPDDFNHKDQLTALVRYAGQAGGLDLDGHLFLDRATISSATNYGGTLPPQTLRYPQYYYRDDRLVVGGDLEARRPFDLGAMSGDVRMGGLSRTDIVRSRRAPAFDGAPRLEASPLDALFFARGDFTQTNLTAYVAADLKPIESLKLSAGLRRDLFLYRFDSILYDPVSAGRVAVHRTPHRGATTIKLGAALQLGEAVTIIANYGESLRAPSALTDLPINADFKIARLRSREVGLAYRSPNSRVRANLNLFQTRLTNEIGYANFLPINNGPSRRDGLDASVDARILDRGGYALAAGANFSVIDARLLDNPLGRHVRQVAPWQGGYTLEATFPGFAGSGDYVSARLDHNFIGPQPLNVRGDIRSKAYDRVAAKLAYHAPGTSNLALWFSVIAYPHNRLSEASYAFNGERYVSPLPPLRVESGVSLGF